MMRVQDLGEFGLIDRIAARLPTSGKGVIVGIGDDAAVVSLEGGKYLLTTCDIQVEGVHFLLPHISPQQLGHKAVAINFSDIAAMGGTPRYVTVSLALPKETPVAFVDGLYEGIRQACEDSGAVVVGGNITTAPKIMVDTFVVGEVEADRLLLRSGAWIGDRVLVTESPGDSAAGLTLILHPEITGAEEHRQWVLARHLTPTPRLREGRVIASSRLATAMIDISDGLAGDIGHICERSGVGVRIWAEALPISEATKAIAQSAGKDPLDWALFGGEDYELLFTAPPDRAEELAERVRRETGTQVTVIGEILPAEAGMSLLLPHGKEVPLHRGGWDHFRRSGA